VHAVSLAATPLPLLRELLGWRLVDLADLSVPRPEQTKPPIALIAELRKQTPVSLAKARTALAQSGNSIPAALKWLQADLATSGAAKAAKVGSRTADEGLIAVSLLGKQRAAMVHVGCETDFVARNKVFGDAVSGVARTAAFLDIPEDLEMTRKSPDLSTSARIRSFPTASLLSAPLITFPDQDGSAAIEPSAISSSSPPPTLSQTLTSTITQTGENIKLRRAVTFAAPFPSSPDVKFLPGVYVHGATSPSGTEGKLGALVVLAVKSVDPARPIARMLGGTEAGLQLEADIAALARTVARQVVGFPTKAIAAPSAAVKGQGEAEYLLDQQPMMFPDAGEAATVAEALEAWGAHRAVQVQVVDMRRWTLADDLADESAAGPV
jgi:elongation factor Ts